MNRVSRPKTSAHRGYTATITTATVHEIHSFLLYIYMTYALVYAENGILSRNFREIFVQIIAFKLK